MLKEKLLKKKNEELASDSATKELLNNDLREIASNGLLPSLNKEELNEKDYKALLKKQLEIRKHVGELKKSVALEQKVNL